MKTLLAFILLLLTLALSAYSQTYTNAGIGSVALSWNPPTNTPPSAIAGYRLYIGTVPGIYTNFASTSGLSWTNTGLVRGVTYYWMATTIGTNNLESDGSNIVSTNSPAPNPPPSILRVIQIN